MRKKNKKILIILISILVVILIMIGLYFYGLTSVSKNSEEVTFTITRGTGKRAIINDLYEAKLIKSKIAATIYVGLHRNLIMQAGTYTLDRRDSTQDIINKISIGDVLDDSIKITFIEGKRVTDYIKQITDKFDYSEEDILKVLENPEYLKKLINKYDFLDESILNNDLYYSLEGYLFPATYIFAKDSSIEAILEKMLDKSEEVLDNYITRINASGYSVHEILTMASIIENETMQKEDRAVASAVIHNRLNRNMSLGMDVTAYYGARKALNETLTTEDLNADNAYNTRNTSFIGLPVGPISNPSASSIEAALNPSSDTYLYFYADKGGKLHFANTYEEFQGLIAEYS